MADLIVCAKFGIEKLRGWRYTEVQTLLSPIETAAVTLTTVLRCL